MTLTTLACALITPPQVPAIPTPPATAPRIRDAITNEVILDPESAGIRLSDPLVEELVNRHISQQNLFAYVNTLAGFGTRHSLSETQLGDYGIGAARRWIHDELVRVGGGRLQVTYDDFRFNYLGFTTQQRNVVATLPGTGTHAGIIAVVAHYDSRAEDVTDSQVLAPGANDNASSVALLIETARVMSSQQWNQTIMFIAFAAEEQGTHGSKHFVQDRMLDGFQFDAVLNNDIVGGRPGIPQSIRVFSVADDLSTSRQFARYIEYVGSVYLPNFSVTLESTLDRVDEFGQRYSDHREFINAGVPAVRITESVEDITIQHTSLDMADLIDYGYLRHSTQLSLAVLANAAGGPVKPAPPTVSNMADAGGFLVTWTPDPTANAYAISFRPLGSTNYPPFRLISIEDAGNVALTGFEPATTYAVSIAGIDTSGRLGLFSNEIIIEPN